jgi:hypothetical protein
VSHAAPHESRLPEGDPSFCITSPSGCVEIQRIAQDTRTNGPVAVRADSAVPRCAVGSDAAGRDAHGRGSLGRASRRASGADEPARAQQHAGPERTSAGSKLAPAPLEADTDVLEETSPPSESTPTRPETTPSTVGVHVGFFGPHSAVSHVHAGPRGVNAAPSRRMPPTLGASTGGACRTRQGNRRERRPLRCPLLGWRRELKPRRRSLQPSWRSLTPWRPQV